MRHWIIGNGPSLRDTPLDLLKDEVTWGMNAIHLAGFKPNNYICVDVNAKDPEWQNTIIRHLDCDKVFLSNDFSNLFSGDITWINKCPKHHYYAADNHMKRAEHWHLPDLCTAFGTMNVALQLATLNGADEIALVGCDLFTGSDDHVTEKYPNYVSYRTRNMIENQIHKVARRSCPVRIVNATIGGNLEVHHRVNFYEYLKKGK